MGHVLWFINISLHLGQIIFVSDLTCEEWDILVVGAVFTTGSDIVVGTRFTVISLSIPIESASSWIFNILVAVMYFAPYWFSSSTSLLKKRISLFWRPFSVFSSCALAYSLLYERTIKELITSGNCSNNSRFCCIGVIILITPVYSYWTSSSQIWSAKLNLLKKVETFVVVLIIFAVSLSWFIRLSDVCESNVVLLTDDFPLKTWLTPTVVLLYTLLYIAFLGLFIYPILFLPYRGLVAFFIVLLSLPVVRAEKERFGEGVLNPIFICNHFLIFSLKYSLKTDFTFNYFSYYLNIVLL